MKSLADRIAKYVLLVPPLAYLMVFFGLPLGYLVAMSLWDTVDFNIVHDWGLRNYDHLLQGVYTSTYLKTAEIAIIVTTIALIIGYPVAYYLARHVHRYRTILLVLVILPLWTSFLIRTFAWILILDTHGVVNTLLLDTHIVNAPIGWLLYSEFAVIVGLVHVYLPFMILPLYAVLERSDYRLLEAASDLGASSFTAFRRITFPLSLPGVVTGCLFVLIPSAGAFVTPQLLGGARLIMTGNVIADQFSTAFQYPFGSALALILIAFLGIFAAGMLRYRTPNGVRP